VAGNYQDSINRLDVSAGVFSIASEFYNLGSVCALTVDPMADRWYFHFEGSSQFGSGSETTAYCNALVATSGSTDLSATSAGPALDVAIGDTIALPVQVDNAGPDTATDVALLVTVPGILEVATVTPSQGSCSSVCGEVVECDLGTVNAGNSATVTLEIEGMIEGMSQVVFRTYGRQIDPDLGDNSGGRQVTVTTSVERQVLAVQDRDWGGGIEFEIWTPDFSDNTASVPINLAGETLYAGNGLDLDPTTGEFFAILSTDRDALRRVLATVDAHSGVASYIGDPGDRFAALAFNDVGNLYALTGQGAAVPETLYELNPATGAATLVGSLANFQSGEALAFNDSDLLLYHLGGADFFESVALPGPVQTPIPMCMPFPGWSVRAASYFGDDQLAVVTNDGVRRLDTDGTHQKLSPYYAGIKGMVLLEPPQSDLSVTLDDSADPVNVGDTFTYTANIVNNGPDPILNLGFVDTLPGHLAAVSATSSQGSCSVVCDQVYCDFGAVASSTSIDVTIDVQAVMAGIADNDVRYSGFGDPNPGDNWAFEDTTIIDPTVPAWAPAELYSLFPWDWGGAPEIRRIDTVTYNALDAVQITLAGSTVTRGNGMAQHPATGVFWALLTLDGQFGRELVTVDPMTGVASSVGDTGDRFAGLAFDRHGVLYGVTGNGANVPLQLFTLDQTTGTPTPFLDISAELDPYSGVAIAYSPGDQMLYVTGGTSLLAVDPSGPSSAPVDMCRTLYATANAATSLDDTNLLLVNDYDDLVRFDLTTNVGSMMGYGINSSKGIVWTEPLTIFADGFESGDTSAWSNVTP
jgi:uncharacterized repeat protein (TIGR01451 family)